MNRIFLTVVAMIWFAGRISFASCPVVDDHGNQASDATPITGGTNVVSGAVGTDVDEDWFRFNALPGTTYSVTLSTSTVWDATVALRAPDGATLLVLTNTASVSPVTATFTNGGALALFYLQVGGYLQFTTGAYGVVVNPVNFTDVDGDGLSDAWETNNFGTLTNGAAGDVDGDGFSNLDEFNLGSEPDVATSGLFVQSIDRTGLASRVTWQSGGYGIYRVSETTNLLSLQTWSVLGTNINLDGSVFESYIDTSSGATGRYYRVEFVY